jgi:hypothetical protein
MDEAKEKALERQIHRRLRELPDLPAPSTLLPRVMAQVRLRVEQPWWRRPLAAWPKRWQVVLVLGLLSLLGLVGWLQWAWEFDLGAVLAAGSDALIDRLGWLARASLTFLGGMALALRAGLANYWAYALGFLLVMYVGCVGIGTACVRLVWNQSLRGVR